MKAKPSTRMVAIAAGAIAAPSTPAEEKAVAIRHVRGAQLPVEGLCLLSPAQARGSIHRPLSPAELRGKVVLVDVWTYTCINWLRTLPYVAPGRTNIRTRGSW